MHAAKQLYVGLFCTGLGFVAGELLLGRSGTDISRRPTPRMIESRSIAGQTTEGSDRGTASAPAGLLARLEVPRIGLVAGVEARLDAGTLRRSAIHIPGTARPGTRGNVCLAGHRETAFRGLQEIRLGDRITLATSDSQHDYVVRDLRIVKPDRIEILEPTRVSSLTLITSYPFSGGRGSKRFVVRAEERGASGLRVAPPARELPPRPLRTFATREERVKALLEAA